MTGKAMTFVSGYRTRGGKRVRGHTREVVTLRFKGPRGSGSLTIPSSTVEQIIRESESADRYMTKAERRQFIQHGDPNPMSPFFPKPRGRLTVRQQGRRNAASRMAARSMYRVPKGTKRITRTFYQRD